MQIGVIILGKKETDYLAEFEKVRDMKLQSCQINIWDMSVYSDETAKQINEAAEKTGSGRDPHHEFHERHVADWIYGR